MSRKSVPGVISVYTLAALLFCLVAVISSPRVAQGDSGPIDPPSNPPGSGDSTVNAVDQQDEEDGQNHLRFDEKSVIETVVIETALAVFL